MYLEGIARDFHNACRNLSNHWRFSLVAICALALGICASTVVFSVADNVFFRPFPYKDFNRSVVFEIRSTANIGGWKGRNFFSPDEFRAFRTQNHVFEEMIAHDDFSRLFFDDGKSTRIFPTGAHVSANTFDFLGVAPLLGRTITKEDGLANAPPVFVMSYHLWQHEFAGDPNILGRSFTLRGIPMALVGIMPPRFNAFNASLWTAYHDNEAGGSLIGRLKPRVSLEAAAADLGEISHRFQKANPRGIFPEKFTIVCHTLLDSMIGDFRRTLYALLGAILGALHKSENSERIGW